MHTTAHILKPCCTSPCLTLWFMEVSEGWQREGGVGDGVDGADIAADVMRVAGLNATHISQSMTTRSKK